MSSLIELIKYKCKQAVLLTYPDLNPDLIEVTATSEANGSQFGDYQFNSAMRFSKILRKPPKEIANNILVGLKKINNTDELEFSSIDIAGPGFINFTLADSFLAKNVELFLKHGKFSWDRNKSSEKLLFKKVVVDFSSPNIAKEMHVGHLRSTIIGDCIARVLEFLGYEVLRINHVGDWGTQFGMLIAYLKKYNRLGDSLVLTDLVDYYKKAKYLFDSDPDFKKTAQQEVVELQRGSESSLLVWKKICEVSIVAYQDIYRLLDIKIIVRGESFYNNMLKQVVEDFSTKKILEESNGAKCVYLTGFTGRDSQPLPLIIQKSDGGYNYATTDLAAIKHRINEEHADWLIYVTDSGQSLHFAMVFAAAKKVGYLDNITVKMDHVPFGLVLRSDGKKFKTREGDTEKLKDLINNAILTAKKLLLERNVDLSDVELEQLAEIIGVNAIKYADLSNNRNSDYVFDYDKMLKFTGNTAAFLSYAYVRINSIKHKVDLDINNLIFNSAINLTDQYQRNLAVRICKFKDVLFSTAEELLPNRLTDYVYLLAEEFHIFFHNCRVIGSEFQNGRLLLCEAVAKIMQICFNLLGLRIIDKM